MVNLVLGGMTPSALSEFVRESKNTITLWVKTADEKGFEALRVKKQTGRPAKLASEDIVSIRAVLEEDDPQKYGYNVWDGPSLSAYILKKYGVTLGVRQCQRMFHNLGFALVRPQTFPSKDKKGLKEEREALKKTKEIMKDESLILVFQDEVHFQVTTSVTRKWVPKGSKPRVGSAPGRKSVPYSGYVIPETGELITTKPTWFNYATVIQSFRDFIAEFPLPEGRKACIAIDNAPWHKKAYRLVQEEALEEYADIREKIELIKLPPYSPDLNPIEQCWRVTRRDVTHNTYFPDAAILESTLDEYFEQYRMPNERFASLCSFKHKN